MKTPLSFLAGKIVGMTMTSCKSLHEEKSTRNAGPCSPLQIIEIADAEARRRGCSLEQWHMIYDEGNAYWNSRVAEMEGQRLEMNALRAKYDFYQTATAAAHP